MHHKFQQREIRDITELISGIQKNSEIKTRLLSIIDQAFSQRSLEIISPTEFLEALLDINVITHQNPTLEELRKKFLLSVFNDTYAGPLQFETLEEIECEVNNTHGEKACKKAWNESLKDFNFLEKSARRRHDIAVNKISTTDKIANLSDALRTCNIGGQSSLAILRDLAKLLLGYTVGKTEAHLKKDQQNTKKQKTVLVEKN